MRVENLEALSEVTALLRGVANRLDFLSGAFQAVGNDKVSDELLQASVDVLFCAGTIEDQSGKISYQSFLDSEQATWNMLAAVLATTATAK